MSRALLPAVTALLFSATVQAQEPTSAGETRVVEVALQSDRLGDDLFPGTTRGSDPELGTADNIVFVTQAGIGNEASVEQRRAAGLANRARLTQRGRDNVAAVLQEGAGNDLSVLQNGYNNQYSLDLDGDGNDLAVSQSGRDNVIRQDLRSAQDLSVQLLQEGDNNFIEHRTDGLTSKGIKITQRADNLNISVTQTVATAPE